ncbi:MAG: hypothetical protein A2148_09185 [Chloroflexi bacterium RBG_16_68_14]|nr:MAG: hypothetical protein A2148_09185 [Chloroflexi bacterium RBG_16_68_14]
MPHAIANSTYTRYVSGGAPVTAYTTAAGAVDRLIEHIDGAREPTYNYLYVPNVDTAQHVYGPHADQTRATLAEADQQLTRLAEGLRGRGRLVASADHGLIEVPDRGKHLLRPDDELLELLVVPPTGEPRVPFFHARAGRADEFRRRFHERFGESYALLSIDEVENLGLLGPAPLADATRRRVGDFVALTDRPEILLYGPPVYHREAAAQRGYHGGLAPAEMRIPLVVA